jgi:hypothetical protein
MAWLTEHYRILSLFINSLMLVVWIFYAHLLLNNYRRQRRPKVLINQGVERGLESRCLLCNMSEESIYIALVVAELQTEDGSWECEVTDFGSEDDPAQSIRDQTTQGPLKSGDFRDIGSYRTLVNRVLGLGELTHLHGLDRAEVELHRLSIHVIGVYVSEDQPVGAARHFDLIYQDEEGYRLKATSIDTERLSSPRHRAKVEEWMKRYL